MLEQDRLTLSIEEAAALPGISRAAAYDLVRLGELPQLRLGRRIVVPRRALENLIDDCTQPNGVTETASR